MNRAEAIEFAKEQQKIFGGKMGEFLEFVEDALTQTNTSNALNALDCVGRQAAIDALSTPHGVLYPIRTIEELPSAERRGKWIKENIVLTSNPPQYQWHCSECGRIVHWFTKEVLTNYCPNCGARMEEDDLQGERKDDA